MAYSDNKYYSMDGGLSYNRLLKHFKDQANGTRNIGLMSDHGTVRDTKAGFRRPRVHGSLVLVDMGTRHDTVNQRGEHVPKVEVVDPTEGDRRRAEAQVAEENQRTSGTVQRSNNQGGQKKGQTRNRRQSGSTTKRKVPPASGTAAAKRAIKRAKDIFD